MTEFRNYIVDAAKSHNYSWPSVGDWSASNVRNRLSFKLAKEIYKEEDGKIFIPAPTGKG